MPGANRSKTARYLLLGVWAAATLVPIAYLMGWHLLTLPLPDAAQLQTALRERPHAPGWRAVHILAQGCKCSSLVMAHLLERKPLPNVAETILYIGGPSPALDAARALGYETGTPTADELAARYGVQAAPLLVVLDAHERIRYSGGYTRIKQGPDIQDVAILRDTLRGESLAALPLFGCAVSRDLQRQIDPLRLKYGSRFGRAYE